MAIDKKFLNLFTKVTEKAAIGASKFIGKNFVFDDTPYHIQLFDVK